MHPHEDGGLGLQRPPVGPKRGMQGLAEALRGTRDPESALNGP